MNNQNSVVNSEESQKEHDVLEGDEETVEELREDKVQEEQIVSEKEIDEDIKVEVSKKIDDIQPVLYFFKVPHSLHPGSMMTATLPPYWLYNDHAFGVIWILFHQNKKFIGISQLHWCLRFLLDLKNSDGEYTGDVNICIQTIQDDLVERYAKLGTIIEQESKTVEKNLNKDINYEISADQVENIVSEEEEEIANKAISCGKKCAGKALLKGKKPISLTYNQMVSKGPTPYLHSPSFQDATSNDFYTARETTEDFMADVEPPKTGFDEMNAEELIKFLNDSRDQHVERIRKEIQRLYVLEKFMGSVNKQSFSAYITDDLAKRLDKMESSKVVEEIQDVIK